MASKFMQRLAKNSKLSKTAILSESEFYKETNEHMFETQIPMLNVALSGRTDGGMSPGILMICGESKSFKTGFMIEVAAGFQKKHPEGVILFYDSEKGAPIKYFTQRGIDMDRVLHTPIYNIEELKFDSVNQLKFIEEEKIPVMIMVDSIGMLPSTKEVANAEDENSAADMTRARELNSLFRIWTPYIAFNNIPCVVINHGYTSMDGKGTYNISGGKKVYLAADDVFVIGRQQDGVASDLKGFFFVLNIDKSRECKEKTKIFIHCTFENGMNPYSGILEEAKEIGLCSLSAWCKLMDFETGEMQSKSYRKGEIYNEHEWFEKLMKYQPFIDHITQKYCLGGVNSTKS